MPKDKRKKGCPNTKCERNKKKYSYKATDQYCTICGEKLLFVCADCFKRIEDTDMRHKYCAICEANREDRKEKRKERLKAASVAVVTVGGAVGGTVAKIVDMANERK